MRISKRRLCCSSAAHGKENLRGAPAPCFKPDLSQDSALYKEIGGLNEIAIAQSNNSLKDICNFRLRPLTLNDGVSGSDDVIMDNILPARMDVSELHGLAHQLEFELLHDDND